MKNKEYRVEGAKMKGYYPVVRTKRKAYKIDSSTRYYSSPQYDLFRGNAGPSFLTHFWGFI